MTVTVSRYNHTAKKLFNKEVTYTNLRFQLLNNSATFTASHTGKYQVDNGSTATVTITIATPGVVSWTAHGLNNGDTVQFSTTGALPSGLTAGVNYYVVNKNTNDFQVSATSGGSAINTTGSQSGVHTAMSGGSYEVFGNGWLVGGALLDNGAVSIVTTNDTMLDCDDETVTASGGSIGPAYKGLIYDGTTLAPLWFYDFGGAETAGDATDFKIVPSASGLFRAAD